MDKGSIEALKRHLDDICMATECVTMISYGSRVKLIRNIAECAKLELMKLEKGLKHER